jgi:2-polyprenyl-6-hydroxyphenyl methylase/3-demethylubiquinone-9 3-methyltransferase
MVAQPSDGEDPATGGEAAPSVDPAELAKFTAMAESWWDPHGKFAPLHKLNPTRIAFIRDRIVAHFAGERPAERPLGGLRLLDVGCGGGLLAEPMARLGATVTGIDAAPRNIAVARLHAARSGLAIDYRSDPAETLAAAGERFDVVLALEVVEHVADLDAFLGACAALLDENGLMFVATLNRTAKAFVLAIVGAEYVLGWLPRGTHDWQRFVRPSEFVLGLRRHGLVATRLAGLSYDLRRGDWAESEDLSVNYMVAAVRR